MQKLRNILLTSCVAMAGILVSAGRGAAQPATGGGEIRLIAQGDDMGVAHGFNVATIRAYKEGILRTANVIITAGWAPEAARFLKENPGLDAGVHLTLTSEWEGVKWRPLTLVPSLSDPFGYLFRAVQPRQGQPGISVKEANPSLTDVEKELRAQIELAKKMIPHLSYMSTHMTFRDLSPEVAALVQKLSKDTPVQISRLSNFGTLRTLNITQP